MELLNFINQKTNNAYKDFKLVSVIFDENNLSCTFKFLYKDNISENTKDELSNLIKQYLQEDVEIIVKCKKAYIDESLIRDVIYNFIIKNFSSISQDFKKEDIRVTINEAINVTISCNEFNRDYILDNSIDKEIINYANGFFFEDFYLNIEFNGETKSDNDEVIQVLDIDLSDPTESNLKYHKVDKLENYIGEVSGNPVHISCIKSAFEHIEIGGTIKFFTEKSFESKRKDKEGNAVIRRYFSFSLSDKTGHINCVYFPTKADMEKTEALADGQNIIVNGDVEDFNGRINFKVKNVAFGELIEEIQQEEEKVVEIIKEPLKDYMVVKPEPHIEMFQDNLFLVQQDVGDYLKKNDVVVFDIETTGLDATRCEIIEIGAVKVSQGKITETFETLIKPAGDIPDEIIELTGITPEMVVNSPNIKQVIPDFYKFCYGCTIMAYNIDFDYRFINIAGTKLGYIFDNKQMDVLYLARAYVPGLKNFKLGSVCKKLEISLENAHRAVHDAMATAEVVIKIGPKITEN